MLILTRKKNTAIRIGDGIVIRVIQTGRSTVKLGIEAPAHVKITRGELEVFAEAAEQAEMNEEELMLQH
ncbi:MAG: carbon storage regulator [Planctomycetaceae bacterium]